jgi:predicted phage terminase large subunit-like protein
MSDELTLEQYNAARRILSVRQARESLIEFSRLTLPDPEDPDNPEQSRYKPVKHHKVIAAALEEVEQGRIQRLIITMPPRHGKSELASRRFPAWFLGRDPYRQMIFATYNADFAQDFGRNVRETMRNPAFSQIFPGCRMRQGSQSSERIETEEGGMAVFVGTGGSLTGRGADLLIIDDPIKDREEADSKNSRDKMWAWFTEVAMTRLMPGGRVVIIMTRWHEDDLIGRLIDPTNPFYTREEAANWKVLALPALAKDNDPMGRKPGDALWPERYPRDVLLQTQRLLGRGFSALYQGDPAPDDGEFFKKEYIRTYNSVSELPRNLRIYAASDHAVSLDQERDATVLMPFGLDEDNNVWILPDVWWRRMSTDKVVDAMVNMIKMRKPIFWWAEKGHITKSIGPFLRKRMAEEHAHCAVVEVTPAKDKMTRAQSILGRMAMGKVYFPKFARWWQEAEAEMLKFPAAKHDDFVDALAYVGIGLDSQVPATATKPKEEGPRPGTWAWIKQSSLSRLKREKRLKSPWS